MTQYIVSSGTTSGITVSSGSVMSVLDTGIAKDITVISGGAMSAYDGGVTSGVVLSTNPFSAGQHAVEYVYAGGTSYKTLVHGSTEEVSGGQAYGTKLVDSGSLNVSDRGLAVSASVGREGKLNVTDGTVSATTLLDDGNLYVSSGGVALNTIAREGGGDAIYSDGTASGTKLLGGDETVFSGGTAYKTAVKAGGQFVAGGTASKTTISSGGYQTVAAGTAAGTTIKAGGIEYVYGGTESGTKIDGGTLVLGGGTAEGAIKFSGSGGELIISSTQMPTNTISGFASGDEIQLASVTYASSDSVSVNAPGVVTVSAGGSEYNLNIAGAKVGETDFVFGPGSILTKNDAPQMAFLRPPASPSAGLDGNWGTITSASGLSIADFAPKIAGGIEVVTSSVHFGGLHSQETSPMPLVIPVSITQPL